MALLELRRRGDAYDCLNALNYIGEICFLKIREIKELSGTFSWGWHCGEGKVPKKEYSGLGFNNPLGKFLVHNLI
jgi:hypothetical protein